MQINKYTKMFTLSGKGVNCKSQSWDALFFSCIEKVEKITSSNTVCGISNYNILEGNVRKQNIFHFTTLLKGI